MALAEATPSILDERAKAYQLDRTRLYVMLPDLYDMIDLNTQKYKDLLIEMISSVNPTLVIIDSLSSIHTNGQNNVEDVRKLLHFLASVADHFHIAILLITHIRKPGFGVGMLQNDVSIEDITGSAHITRVGRSVIGMNIIQTGPVLDPNGPRQFKMLKSNIGEIEKPLSFEFAHFQSKGVYLKWNTQLPGSYKQPTKTDECATWLIETLTAAGRPLSPKFLIEQSEVYGFSRRTLYRARESLSTQIRNTHDNNHPDNTWQLIPSPSRSGDLYRRDGEGPGLGLGSDEESFDSLSLEGRGQGEDDHSPLSIDDLSMGRAGEGSGLGSGKDKKND